MLQRLRIGQGKRALAAASSVALAASALSLVTSAPAQAADPVSIQIIGTNDFHGRLTPGSDPGAARYAGALDQFRAENPNTVFAAAGDLIGATTFESFINHDKPTIDVFNAMGLDVSAVGNHELDQGYDDLVDRVMAPFDVDANPFGGAAWEYVAANIEEPGGADEIAPSWTVDVAGVTVGFVGAVTEYLHELVSPSGIEGLTTTDIVEATNTEAAALKAAGVDVVVLLVHEGARVPDCSTMAAGGSDFAPIINDVSGDVDAIVSGHTHLNYDCSFPVADWADRAVTERPVVSAGQYGHYLNRMTFTVDPDTGTVLAVDNENVNVSNAGFAEDPEVAGVVARAEAAAVEPGSVVLGKVAGPFKRATRPRADGSGLLEENRGGESTLGNVVAEALRWTAGAQIGLMNPGGLRADMLGTADAGYPAPLTYKQAADVQPFANTVVSTDLTGAQLKALLEEQWQPEGSSRVFRRLGSSEGFTYTYDPRMAVVTDMWLHGDPVDLEESYSVSVNAFLASGGDSFLTFLEGADLKDTGKTDLQAMVDYLGEFGASAGVAPDFAQHAVGVRFPDGASGPFRAGGRVKIKLSSLAMTGAGDLHDDAVTVAFGERELGSFPVDNTVAPGAVDDESGRASVRITLPAGVVGAQVLTVTGRQTGTRVTVPITVAEADSKTTAEVAPKRVVANRTKARVEVAVQAAGADASGKVRVRAGGRTYTATLKSGGATVRLKPFQKAGKRTVRVRYLGDDYTLASSTKVTIKVTKATKRPKKR